METEREMGIVVDLEKDGSMNLTMSIVDGCRDRIQNRDIYRELVLVAKTLRNLQWPNEEELLNYIHIIYYYYNCCVRWL